MEISSKEKEQEEWLHCLITIYCFDLTEEILAFFWNIMTISFDRRISSAKSKQKQILQMKLKGEKIKRANLLLSPHIDELILNDSI